MAIKRFTIELDDTPDTETRTSSPESLMGGAQLQSSSSATQTPAQQLDYQEEGFPQKDTAKFETIGRTPSDLFVAFINRPEFMATGLTFLSFIIFYGNLKQVADFLWPLIVAAILNIVWFGTIGVRWFIVRHAMKQTKHDT